MARLRIKPTGRFVRDAKLMARRRDIKPLHDVIDLIAQNDLASRDELIRRHNMHKLSGRWAGWNECHMCNVGDWLLVWAVREDVAVLQRTGTHDQIFGK